MSKLDLGFQMEFQEIEISKKCDFRPSCACGNESDFSLSSAPKADFFLIIRFPNLESSALGTKFSSGPVEQTGTVGLCFHLLLVDNPMPLMGADCTHHKELTQLI